MPPTAGRKISGDLSKSILNQLLAKEENKICADCSGKGYIYTLIFLLFFIVFVTSKLFMFINKFSIYLIFKNINLL